MANNYSDYMNKRMQDTPEGKQMYDEYMSQKKKVVDKVKSIRPKITKKIKKLMGLK